MALPSGGSTAPQSGLRLVLDGYESFVRELGDVNKRLDQFDQRLGAVEGASTAAGGGLGGLGAALGSVFAVAAGMIAADVLSKIAQGVKEIGEEAFKTTAEFQNLEIRFENLIARQLRTEDQTLSVARSFEIAEGQTQSLLGWVRELSLTNPVDPTVIANTLALAQAFGFTAGQAIPLTEAILNFTAGMGLSNTEAERIIVNFGQMIQQGKVTQRELSDLARGSLVPVTDVLRRMQENLGLTNVEFDEFRQQAAAGVFPVSEFVRAFEQVANEDFPNALERMGGTLQGVQIRAKNFIRTIVGLNVLGPIGERIASFASDILEGLLSPAVQRSTGLLGVGLAEAFDNVVSIGQDVVGIIRSIAEAFGLSLPPIENFAAVLSIITEGFAAGFSALRSAVEENIGTIADAFIEAAKQAFEWGFNIIGSLAEGMVNAAGTVITSAMNFIASRIFFWLGPGSPPRVAPGLIEWGLSAMTEFLRGFTEADFDVLKAIQRPLKQALDIFVDLEAITGEQALGAFSELSQDIAEGIAQFADTGVFDQDILEELRNSTGEFGDELARLLEVELDLAAGIREVEEAQLALNAAQERSDRATSAVQGLVDEYNELLRAGADPAILDQRLAEINAAEDELALAREQEVAAEGRLNQAEEALDPLERQAELQEELVQQLIKLSEVFTESLGGAGAEGPEAEFEPGDLPGFDIEGMTDQLKEDLEKAFDDLKTRLRAKWAEVIDSIRQHPVVQRFLETWEENVGKIEGAWSILSSDLRKVFDQHIAPILEDWGIDTTNLQTIQETLGDKLREVWEDKILPALEKVWKFISEDLNPIWQGLLDLLGGTLDVLTTLVADIGVRFVVLLDTIYQRIRENEFLMETFATLWNAVGETIALIRDTAPFVGEFLSNLGDWLHDIARGLEEAWPLIPRSPAPLAEGLSQVTDQLVRLRDVSGQQQLITPAVMAAAPSVLNRSTNVNMGGVNINNAADLAQFEALIRRVIREG